MSYLTGKVFAPRGTGKTRRLWIALLLLATALRLPAPDWDAPATEAGFAIAAHPDERFLIAVAQATPLWGDPCATTPDFPYGHLPVYVARLFVMAAPSVDPLITLRLFSGLLGVLLVALAGAWGRALAGNHGAAGRWGALLAAALMAFAPFPIQQARFYTVDILGAIFASGAILAATRRRWSLAGALAGLALACKASLVWCAVVVGLGVWVASWGERVASHEKRVTRNEKRVTRNEKRVSRLLSAVSCLFLAFFLASPWAVLRPLTAWNGPMIQAMMASGRFDFPYTRQYVGTLPFLYPLAQMMLWGLGPATTLLGMAGMAMALRRRRWSFTACLAGIWTLAYFLVTAGLYVKFPRYLLPLYPLWTGWAASACVRRQKIAGVRWRLAAPSLVVTALLGWAQVSIYAAPHPWIVASRWMYANVPAGATVAVEAWDHALPVPLPEGDAERYTTLTLPVFAEDTAEKLAQLTTATREAEIIVLASRRGYGALARQPARYAATLAWYAALLREREVIAFGRCPRLGPLALSDDPLADAGLAPPLSLAERCGTRYALRLPHLDESFRVYDAPMVLLLTPRTPRYSMSPR
ncbi:MAG TPA: hypothetical protein PLJ78_10030 [Anaerolineae bacterium]|nr:hypothetical protein [Anaerolineae bacterium]HQK14267.1 hypothetical protein [Anaerolineae bacterium]